MATVNLTEGDHTIEWSLDGYETISADINISSTGILSCISTVTGTCQEMISIADSSITAILKQITEPLQNICKWI